MRWPPWTGWAAMGLLATYTACRGPTSRPVSVEPESSPAKVEALRATARAHWSGRDDQQALSSAIMVWEQILEIDPHDAEVLTALSRACYFLAYAFLALEADNPEIEFAAYQKGVDYAERALRRLEPGLARTLDQGVALHAAAEHIQGPGARAAYWYAVNLGRFAARQGLSTQLHYHAQLKAIVDRVQQVAPGLERGGPDRFLGAYYAALPPVAGQDLEKSARHFAAARAYAPDYLVTSVLEARFLATAARDRARFEALLRAVVAASADADPEVAPENRAAQRTARAMLDGAPPSPSP